MLSDKLCCLRLKLELLAFGILRWFLVVKQPHFGSVLRPFTGTNSGRQPTLFAFLILLERCAHVYARAGKSSLFKRFLGSLPITIESIVRFLIKEMLFSKI